MIRLLLLQLGDRPWNGRSRLWDQQVVSRAWIWCVTTFCQAQPTSPTYQSRKFRVAYEIGFLLLYVGYILLRTFKCLGMKSARCFCKSVGNDLSLWSASIDPFSHSDRSAHLKSGVIAWEFSCGKSTRALRAITDLGIHEHKPNVRAFETSRYIS